MLKDDPFLLFPRKTAPMVHDTVVDACTSDMCPSPGAGSQHDLSPTAAGVSTCSIRAPMSSAGACHCAGIDPATPARRRGLMLATAIGTRRRRRW